MHQKVGYAVLLDDDLSSKFTENAINPTTTLAARQNYVVLGCILSVPLCSMEIVLQCQQ